MACAPILDWVEDRIGNFPRRLAIGGVDLLGPVDEWGPYSGISMGIFDALGVDYRVLGGLGIFEYYRGGAITGRKLIFGPGRHKGDIDE